jgi:diacylglycerol kinase
VKKFLMGFVFAGRGLAAGLRGGTNLKVMVVLGSAAVALGIQQGISRLEWVALILCIGLVLSLELLNTAGERLIDILCPDHDPRYGMVKDILAAAVLVAAVAAAVVGVLVFLG